MGARDQAEKEPFAYPEPSRFVGRTLRWVRWATIAALLLLTLVQPEQARAGLPMWVLVLLFAVYNLFVDLFLRELAWARFVTWRAILDALAVGFVYFLGPEPGGPLFVLFFLAVVCATASMPLGSSLLYTAVLAGIAAILDLGLPAARAVADTINHLGSRLVVLGLVGAGMAILTRRLVLEQDATQLVRSEAERLTELERVREDFIATVSHELRTPLTAARAALGVLATSAGVRLQPEEQELLSTAERNVERLKLLIDDLLAFNQIEAGTFDLGREPLDLRAVVMSAIAAVQPLLREKGQSLEIDLPEPLPAVGDQRRLEQAVVNLLSNAYHHTPSGTHITIVGRATARELVLSLHDNGPGIPVEELEAIFERFYRLPPAAAGSGLGLAIAKAIIELHGGRIWAESRREDGTTFHISLPLFMSMERDR